MKRYNIVPACELISGLIGTREDPNGEWVRWQDHKTNMARVEYHGRLDKTHIKSLEDKIRDLQDNDRDFKLANGALKVAEGELIDENRQLRDEIRRLKTKNIQTYDEYIEAQRDSEDVLKVKDVTECNCSDMATGTMAKYPNMLMADWWVCPKHGYKKR